jgi:hypothetical protein
LIDVAAVEGVDEVEVDAFDLRGELFTRRVVELVPEAQQVSLVVGEAGLEVGFGWRGGHFVCRAKTATTGRGFMIQPRTQA